MRRLRRHARAGLTRYSFPVEDDRQLPVDGSLFEALYRLRAPAGALAERLLALGVDPTTHARRYRADQWKAALTLYRDELFPLDYTTGYRRLGYALAQAYAATFSGRLFMVALPMLTPLQLLRRWPRFVRMGRTDVELDVHEDGPHCLTVVSRDPHGVSIDVTHGMLDFVFERMGARVQVSDEARDDRIATTYRW